MNSYFILDSNNKTSGTNPQAVYTLNTDLRNVSSIGLSAFNIVDNIKNVNELNESTFYIDDGSTSYPVTIIQGWYNYIDLAAAIQDGLNATQIVGTPFVCTYDTTTHKFTITCSFAFTLKKLIGDRTILDMIGIKADFPLSLTVSSSQIVDINYTNKIFICSSSLHEKKSISDSTNIRLTNILGIVYLIKDSIQQFDKSDVNSPKSIYPKIISERIENIKFINLINSGSIKSVDINLYDDSGKIMPNDIGYTLEFLTR